MSKKICIFAGTTEGRRLTEILKDRADLTVCVATEYGEVMLDGIDGIDVLTGRMDEEGMAELFCEKQFDLIIDATHPYASVVTENICSAAERTGAPVMRILRENDSHVKDAIYVSGLKEAAEYLRDKVGNIFVTTGAKELSDYEGMDMSRAWVRVLPSVSSLEACANAGVPQSHIIAAQGPFSYDMNLAQLRMIGADYMITKASGRSGGFDEKIAAALDAGAVPVIIGQPPQVRGISMDEAIAELDKDLTLSERKVFIIGVGPGSHDLFTLSARTFLEECDAVIGASSVTEVINTRKPVYNEYLPAAVRSVLDEHPSVRRAAVVMRGDTGFFSGTKKLIGALDGYHVEVVPGISSVSLLAAKLGVSWEDAKMVSLHGREGSIAVTAARNRKCFVLCGGSNTPEQICARLCEYGHGSLDAAVGEKLSYSDERVTKGKVSELSGGRFDPLSVLYIENPSAHGEKVGIPDEDFIRAKVPMTKSEVRAVSVSKMGLNEDSVVWDVGAGTGSVSVECALAACSGAVYAIEKEDDAADLIGQNSALFHTDNIKIVHGSAPEALADLPAPTHVFIGGSGGNLSEIIRECLVKNPDVRIVINTVTLESQAEAFDCASQYHFEYFEAVSVNISRSRKLGRYNMMMAQNPVMVFTLQGGKIDG